MCIHEDGFLQEFESRKRAKIGLGIERSLKVGRRY